MCECHADVLMATTKTENCLLTRASRESIKAGKCTEEVPFQKSISEWPILRSQCKGHRLRRKMDPACHAAPITYVMTASFAKQLAINVVGKDTSSVCRKKQKTLFCDQEVKQKDSELETFTTLATNYDSSQHITYDDTLKEGKALPLIVDTGSQECLIKKSMLCNIYPKAVIKPTSVAIVGITGHSLQVLEKSELQILHQGKYVAVPFTVVHQGPNILGLSGIHRLNLELSDITKHSFITMEPTRPSPTTSPSNLRSTIDYCHFYRRLPESYRQAVCAWILSTLSLTTIANRCLLSDAAFHMDYASK